MYTEKFKIGIKDIDNDLKILNKSILELLENVAVFHADSVNRGPYTTYKEGFAWVLSDWKVQIVQRPAYGEELFISTWRRDTKRFYTYRDYKICDSQGNVKVIATSKWAMLNFKTGKLMKVTDELEKWNLPSEDEGSVFESRKIEKVQLPEKFQTSTKYTVMRKDIDVNGHMHNLSYLDLAYEVMPEDIFKNSIFDKIHIDYKKEIKLGDTIICNYAKNGESVIVEITNEKGDIIHAVIELK